MKGYEEELTPWGTPLRKSVHPVGARALALIEERGELTRAAYDAIDAALPIGDDEDLYHALVTLQGVICVRLAQNDAKSAHLLDALIRSKASEFAHLRSSVAQAKHGNTSRKVANAYASFRNDDGGRYQAPKLTSRQALNTALSLNDLRPNLALQTDRARARGARK
jgi:hypothetical protein